MLGIGPIIWNHLRTRSAWFGLARKPTPRPLTMGGTMSTRYYKAIDSVSRGARKFCPAGATCSFCRTAFERQPFP